jgi:uncharacterized protein (DUF433 family)
MTRLEVRMAWYDQYVAHYVGVQGGMAVIAGTRTPVLSIIAKYDLAGGDIQDVITALPHLDTVQVDAALAYAKAHPEEMAAEEALQEHALLELLFTR